MDDLRNELLAAVTDLPSVATGRLPQLVEDAWPDCVRISLRGWARGLGRDLDRATSAFAGAHLKPGLAPDDDQIAALEECFWRIAAAVEKFDALVSLAYNCAPLRPHALKPTRLEMRPSSDRNKKELQKLGSDAARQLIERRSKISGTRAELRRHQIMHSLAPLAAADDLACFIEAVHRDGRIMVGGYNVVRVS